MTRMARIRFVPFVSSVAKITCMNVLEQFRLDGRVALVTGCSRLNGLGYGMAEALAEAGADIAAVSTRPVAGSGERIRKLGRRYVHLAADLGSLDALDRVIRETVEQMG